MASIAEIRSKFPQYSDLSDQALADALYSKHYSDMPRADFDTKVGLTPAAPPGQIGPEVTQLKGSVVPQAARPVEGSANIEDRRPPLPRAPLDFGTATAATINGIVNGIPVLGPMARDITDRAQAGVGALMGNDYGQGLADIQKRREEIARGAPISDVAGNIVGAVGAFGVGGASSKGAAEALGMAGKFIPRVINSGVSGAAISAGDTAVRGGSLNDILSDAARGGALNAAIPMVGEGLKVAGQAAGRVLQPTVGAIVDPITEALRRTGKALARDARANPGSLMSGTDEAVARQAGVPILNADRGGETVRALTRSVANQSPEARGVIEKTASDRFAGQADRAVQMVRRIAGGQVDDLAYQANIKRAAEAVNDPAYKAAWSAPGAHAVWNRDIAELMQSDTFRAAINAAEKRGTDRAAVAGFKAVRNPFEFRADGTVTLKTNPDGSRALPSLQFWDQVKRNVDGMIGTAQRQGDNTLVADLTAIKRKLVSSLDAAVPQYAKARSGAAAFFDAEDALDAGKKFATATRAVPEAKAAFGSMNQSEQQAFRTGYASEIIDKIRDGRFRANIIDSAFGSPAKREMIEVVFGKAKARELEAYVRVEEIADRLRGAMGNSTTARQLMELGIGAGSGAILTGGDWKGALSGAAFAKGARFLNQKVDDRVMQEVAALLMSGDETLMQKAVYQATLSPMWMDALESWGRMLAPVSRGVQQEMSAGRPQPVEITVRGGNPALLGSGL